jgi:arabinosyltransferase C
LAVVMVLVDVAVVRRNLAVLTVAAAAASLTLGVGPTGLVAFGPFLVATPRLVRWFRAMAVGERLTAVLLFAAGVGVVAVPMFADQSWAAVRAGTAIRMGMGPSFPWWEDWRRYLKLIQAPFAKQWAVYLTAVAAAFAGVVALKARRVAGVRRAMQTTTLGSVALVVPLMALAPTKLHHHFGALMLAGPLVVGLALHLLRGRPQLSPLLWCGALTSLGVGLGAALAAPSSWWQLSALGIPNATRAQQVAGVALATPVLAVGVLLGVAVLLAGSLATGPSKRNPRLRRLPFAGLLAVGLTVALVAQLGSFGYAAVRRAGRYTLATANLHALAGDPCLLENTVQVEPDPGGSALSAEGGAGDFSSAATVGLPTWSPHADRGSWRSGWFTLPTNVRDGSAQLVIRVRGLTDQRSVWAEFDTGSPVRLRAGGTDGYRYVDHRISLPERKYVPQRVRLSAVWSGGRGRLTAAVPRAQQMVSLRELSRHAAVTSGWKLAFFTPCLTPTAETAGAVAVPQYWLSREQVLNEMEWTPRLGRVS